MATFSCWTFEALVLSIPTITSITNYHNKNFSIIVTKKISLNIQDYRETKN